MSTKPNVMHGKVVPLPRPAPPTPLAARDWLPASPDDPEPVASGGRRRWEHYTGPELARLAKENPARFRALKADRVFRREIGMLGLSDEMIVEKLNRWKADKAARRFTELRQACW